MEVGGFSKLSPCCSSLYPSITQQMHDCLVVQPEEALQSAVEEFKLQVDRRSCLCLYVLYSQDSDCQKLC